jgi:hypothetical protein
VNRQQRAAIARGVERELDLAPGTTHKEVCRQVGALMSRRLGSPVELRFGHLGAHTVSGLTARRADGSYLVLCARSPSWYHRLQIVLHELAHLLLEHQVVSLSSSAGLRRFAPSMLPRMAKIISGRSDLTEREELDAEQLADELLERLTEHKLAVRPVVDMTAHLGRVADTLGYQPNRPDDADRSPC